LRNGALTCSPKFISSFNALCWGQDAASKPHHCANTNVASNGRGTKNKPRQLRQNKFILLGLVLSTPLTVFASGGFVIPSLIINFCWLTIITLVIFRLKIKREGKIIIFVSFIGTMFLMFFFFQQLNALEDIGIINFCSAIIPPTATYVIYRLTRTKYKLTDD
jgi:hypothetical protein